MNTAEREALTAAIGEAIASEIDKGLSDVKTELMALRLKLETAELRARELRYAGTWSSQGRWKRGNFVSHQGSLWHCNVDGISTVPGHDHDGWQLCVKSMSRA